MRPSTRAARADLQHFLDAHLASLDGPQVMDAGCGGAMRVALPAGAVLNGIDISPESAARNSSLFNIVIGDVQNASSAETINFMRAHGVDVIILDPLKSASAKDCIALCQKFRKEKPELWLEDWGGGPRQS